MRKKSICLVDDDPNEIRWFRENLKDYFNIGAGQSEDLALDDLKGQFRPWQWWKRIPKLFLLDLYFPDHGSLRPGEAQRLRAARTQLLRAQADFRAFLATIGQSPDTGVAIARRVKRRYGPFPFFNSFSFFTRKGTLEDAIRAYEQERATSVIKKPEPNPPAGIGAITEAMEEQEYRRKAADVAGHIERALDRASLWSKIKRFVYGAVFSFLISLGANYVYGFMPTRHAHTSAAPTCHPSTPKSKSLSRASRARPPQPNWPVAPLHLTRTPGRSRPARAGS